MAVRGDRLRFWVAAGGAAVVWAIAASFLSSSEFLGAVDGAARLRVWLLMLWTGGVMAICFGAAGLIGVMSPIGFREVQEAGSVTAAMMARRRAKREGTPFHRNFAWWLVMVGVLLIAIYFLAWGITDG